MSATTESNVVRPTDEVSKHDPTWSNGEVLHIRREDEPKKNTTDYKLPIWWHDPETTDEERVRWFERERARRQFMRQVNSEGAMPFAEMMMERASREQRKKSAAGELDLDEWR
jgi:hypothetical protein